ncbi:MAG: hypothetical protein ACUVTO_01245 [Candidatus Caldatribacteriaceae bacterium]
MAEKFVLVDSWENLIYRLPQAVVTPKALGPVFERLPCSSSPFR